MELDTERGYGTGWNGIKNGMEDGIGDGMEWVGMGWG